MKKTISVLLVLCVLLSCYSLPGFAAKNNLSVFVQSGAQGGDGSFVLPFGSFNEARDYIRGLKASRTYPAGGVTVFFREGKYFLSEGIMLDENDSGTENAPVIYRPWKDEKVSFIGGAEIPLSDFKSVSDENILARLHPNAKEKIVYVNLKEYGVTEYGTLNPYGNILSIYNVVNFPYKTAGQNELFVDGKRMTAARWPNEGTVKVDEIISKGTVMQTWRDDLPKKPEGWVAKDKRIAENVVGPQFTIADENDTQPWKRWKDAKDMMIYGRLFYDWSDEGMPVSVDENGVISSEYPLSYGVKTGGELYFWNILEELDVPGEWYLDRDSGVLYFYPNAEAQGSVQLSIIETPILDIKDAEHIVFKNLGFEAGKNHGINMIGCSNITLEGLTIRNLTKNGIYSEKLSHCKILDCEITGCGEIGATVDGGNKETYERASNLISNCHIYSNAILKETYAPGIRLTGCGNTASHNEIHDMPHAGIVFNGSYNTVEYNELYDVVNKSNDMGAIYSFRLRTHVGCIVRHNYIHDLAGIDSDLITNILQPGVYLDGGRSFVTVESNIFENLDGVAFCVGGRANNVTNNLFINVGYAGYVSAGQWTDVTYQNLSDTGLQSVYDGKLDLSQSPYNEVPHLSDILDDDPMASKYFVYENNVFVNPPAKKEIWWRIPDNKPFGWKTDDDNERTFAQWLEMGENTFEETYLVSMAEAGFEDTQNRNYILKADSPIYTNNPDFKPCDFANVGRITPKLEAALDNSVSLKIGSPKAQVGLTPAYIDEANTAVVPWISEDHLTYVPLRFIAENIGAKVDWNEVTSVATVTLGSNILTVHTNNGEIIFDDAKLEGVVRVNNDRSYVPLRIISEAFGKSVSWYEQGLIIIGNEEFPVLKEHTSQLELLERMLTVNIK